MTDPRPLSPRGTRFRLLSTDPVRLAAQCASNFQHLETLLESFTEFDIREVTFAAQGSTSATIPLRVGNRDVPPRGLLCVRVFETKKPDTFPTLANSILNMVWEGSTRTASFYEPSGLTADTSYTLTVLVVG